jgi:hypothetical protein
VCNCAAPDDGNMIAGDEVVSGTINARDFRVGSSSDYMVPDTISPPSI